MPRFPYLKTLGDSFALTFKNFLLFVPAILVLLLNILFSVALIPFTAGINVTNGFSIKAVVLLALFGLFSVILTLIAYGWFFALVKRMVEKKKLKLSEAFSEGLPLSLKYLKAFFIIGVLFIAISVITLIVGGTFSLIPVAGIAFIVILAICEAFFLFLALCASFYLTPIIILEKAGAWKSIKLNYHLFMKHKRHTVKMALLTILIMIVASLPSLTLQFQAIIASFSGQVVEQTPSLSLSLINQLLTIPIQIAIVVITVFYTLAYLKLKKVPN